MNMHLDGARIGVFRDLFRTGAAHAESLAIIDQALDDLADEGAVLVEDVSLGFDLFDFLAGSRVNLFETQPAVNAYLDSLGPSAPVSSLQAILADGQLLPRTNLIFSFAQSLDSSPDNPEYLALLSRRTFLQEATTDLLEALDLDALVYPMKTLPAPFIGEISPESENPFSSISGLPGIVVPAGYTADGLPVSLEFSGQPFSEALLLGYAYDYEQATQHRVAPATVPPLSAVVPIEIVGTAAADVLVGDAFDNRIDALAGNDTVAGGLGDDVLLGGAGDDVLRGDLNVRAAQNAVLGGDDVIFGGEGNDRIGGKAGNDRLSGDGGDDVLYGDAGDDVLRGGAGSDVLVGDNFSGGSGSDLFVFGRGEGTDTVLDFEVGVDRIGLVEGELAFADLAIAQAGDTTVLGVSGGEVLAVLRGVEAASLGEGSFVGVADGFEGAIALS
ncbi:MAG: amidase family protein [Cyanobacteria bacterium P01_A01_bin.116]